VELIIINGLELGSGLDQVFPGPLGATPLSLLRVPIVAYIYMPLKLSSRQYSETLKEFQQKRVGRRELQRNHEGRVHPLFVIGAYGGIR
jgi:hypothetical protein